MGKELTYSALLAEMANLYGPRRMLALLGVAAVASTLGVEDHDEFIAMPFGSLPSRYRWWAEYRALRDGLVDLGYDVSAVPADMPVRLVAVATERP